MRAAVYGFLQDSLPPSTGAMDSHHDASAPRDGMCVAAPGWLCTGSIKIVYDPQPTPKAIADLLGIKIKQVRRTGGGGCSLPWTDRRTRHSKPGAAHGLIAAGGGGLGPWTWVPSRLGHEDHDPGLCSAHGAVGACSAGGAGGGGCWTKAWLDLPKANVLQEA
jgi:hypothetical protein